MPPSKPDWREFGLFDSVELNLLAMETVAARLGYQISDTDRKEMRSVAEERASLFQNLKAALLAGDKPTALRLGRELCGLPKENGPAENLVPAGKE